MDNMKDNEYYVQKIRTDLAFIVSHMNTVSEEEFYSNEILLDSMMFRMIQISENCKRLTDAYKLSRPEVPWNAMAGMRNRIVHDYGNVDLGIIFETLKNDIPALLESI